MAKKKNPGKKAVVTLHKEPNYQSSEFWTNGDVAIYKIDGHPDRSGFGKYGITDFSGKYHRVCDTLDQATSTLSRRLKSDVKLSAKKNPRGRQAGVTKGGSAGKYIKYENRIRKMTSRQLDAEKVKMRSSLDEDKLKVLEIELYMRRAWNPNARGGETIREKYERESGTDVPTAMEHALVESSRPGGMPAPMESAFAEGAVRSLLRAKLIKKIGDSYVLTRRGEKKLGELSPVAWGMNQNPKRRKGVAALGYDPKDSNRLNLRNLAAKRAELEQELLVTRDAKVRLTIQSAIRRNIAVEKRLGQAESARPESRQRKRLKKTLSAGAKRLERQEKQFARHFEANPSAAEAAPKFEKEADLRIRQWIRSKSRRVPDYEALMVAYDSARLAAANFSLTEDGDGRKRMLDMSRQLREEIVLIMENAGGSPISPINVDFTENPTSMRHLKIGRAALKKSEKDWDTYLKRGSKKALLTAYESMLLAKTELKYGGDAAGVRQANTGLKIARAELK